MIKAVDFENIIYVVNNNMMISKFLQEKVTKIQKHIAIENENITVLAVNDDARHPSTDVNIIVFYLYYNYGYLDVPISISLNISV